MIKIIIAAALLLNAAVGFSQQTIVAKELRIGANSIIAISNDTSMRTGGANILATEYAVSNFVLNHRTPTPSLQTVSLIGNRTNQGIGFNDLNGAPVLFHYASDFKQGAINFYRGDNKITLTAAFLPSDGLTLYLPGENGVLATRQWISANPNVDAISFVSSFATYNKTGVNTIIVMDTLRGGTFSLYTGANAPDNGVIFTDALNRKWKRQLTDYININWFGAVPSVNTLGQDNRNIIISAITSGVNNLPIPKIYIPQSPYNYTYFCSDSILINNRIILCGDGSDSKIRFAADRNGFTLAYITSSKTEFRNIDISAYSVGGTPSKNITGINIKSLVYFNNVTVREFDGIGINIVTSITGGGNANNSVFTNCSTQQNRIHGFYVKGSDANNMAFNNCEAVSNGGTGFSDQSFLGNSYTKFHAASNGSPELSFQAGLVTYNGHTYACKLDSTVNILPTNATAWQDLGILWVTGFPYVLPYDASKIYYVAAAVDIEGANIVSGQNQSTTLIGCYVESDQPPSYVGANAIIIGGNLAASTFRAGNIPAKLAGGNFALTTYNNFWSGNPGNFGTRRTYQSPNGFVVTVASGNELMLGYDTTRKALDIVDPTGANGTGKFKIPSQGTIASYLNRTNLINAVPLFSHGAMFATVDDRTQYQNIDFARSKPTNSNSDYGDIVFATHRLYLDNKPDVILYKFIEKSAGAVKQWTAVNGFVEYAFTSTDASSYQVCMDYYPSKAIKYDIQILCSDNAGNYWNETRSILVGLSAGTTVIKDNTLIGTSFKDGALSSCSFTPTISGGSFEIYIAGKVTTTITWKIHIKRMIL